MKLKTKQLRISGTHSSGSKHIGNKQSRK